MQNINLYFRQIFRQEIIWWTAAPVDNVLILALTALLSMPIRQMEIIVDCRRTVDTVLQHSMKERLQQNENKYIFTHITQAL